MAGDSAKKSPGAEAPGLPWGPLLMLSGRKEGESSGTRRREGGYPPSHA